MKLLCKWLHDHHHHLLIAGLRPPLSIATATGSVLLAAFERDTMPKMQLKEQTKFLVGKSHPERKALLDDFPCRLKKKRVHIGLTK